MARERFGGDDDAPGVFVSSMCPNSGDRAGKLDKH